MKKNLLAIMILAGLALGACQEDPTMDELTNEIELTTKADPDDDIDPPGNN